MQQRTKFWLSVGVAVLAAAFLWFWFTDNQQDRRVWVRYRDQLTPERIAKVEIGGTGRTVALSDTEKQEVLTLLQQAKYVRSNRQGHGPTPQALITLTYADGTREQIGIWGGPTLELSPRRLDPRTQFLIESSELYIWLQNRFKGPAIGAGGMQPPAQLLFRLDSSYCQYTADRTAPATIHGRPST